MTKYILHIGPSKTGSKFIQSQLYHSRPWLRSKGVCYPDVWWARPDEIMHERLLLQLLSGSTAELRDAFQRINAARPRVVVLSCEGFDDLAPQQIRQLRDAIGHHPVEVVYYCRRWSDRIPSDWRQHIKMGHFPTLPQFYVCYLKQPSHTLSVNYSLVLNNFSEVFGRSSINLVSYSNLQDNNVDMFKHFVHNFLTNDVGPAVDDGLIQRNRSPGVCDSEILRVLNCLDYEAFGRPRVDMRVKFELMRPHWDTARLVELMADDHATLEISDDAEPFKRSWKATSTYADRLVSKEYGREIFRRNTAGVPYVRSNYLLRSEASSAFRTLYEDMRNTPLDHPLLA